MAEVFADTAFFYRDSSIYHLRNPELILFTEIGGPAGQGHLRTWSIQPEYQGVVGPGQRGSGDHRGKQTG